MRLSSLLALSISLCALATPVSAQPGGPRIAGYGAIAPLSGAETLADRSVRYRMLFNVTKAAATPDKVNPSLDKVARLLNLLGRDSIRPAPGDLVVIVHGAATPIVTNSTVYEAKTRTAANPNLELIARLRAAGVTVAICSQALYANRIAPKDVAPGVRIDLSAMTTLAALQARGWALIPD